MYINKDKSLCIEIFRENKQLIISDYDFSKESIIDGSSGVVVKLGEELSADVSKHFDIDLKEYQIKIINIEETVLL